MRDNYGLFPILCPNGSGHSIRIGNTATGQTADKVSYTFTIPAGENTYNLIYHYALVLNDANNSGHTPALQPRFIISVLNMTDGGIPLPCALPPIVVNGGLPGFFDSPNPAPNGSLVRCKNWAAASINLDNLAGKTIELSFTVTGCGLSNGSHFGYAYIDLNSECSSSFNGATFCPDDTVVNIIAPYGYQSYKWFDISNTILGTNQTLTLNPPPLSGDSVFVELTPFNGYGCLDTLTAHLWDTLTVYAYAGRDTLVCSGSPVQLGAPPRLGQTYSWSPPTYLNDPNISNPVATVAAAMTYILSVTNSGGGCLTKDTVQVNYALLSDSLELIGPASQCTANGQTVTLKVFPADSIQWYQNSVAIPGATATTYVVTQTGSYQATLFSFAGCNKSTRIQQIDIFESPVSGFTINDPSQCHSGNSFVFTNTSTISAGALSYAWDLGDGTLASTHDVTHTYLLPGTYTVKMVVTAPGGCSDSTISSVTVFPGPTAGFNVSSPVQCQKGNLFNFTNTSTITSGVMLYQWNMGDGNLFNTRDVTHTYLLPGTYTVELIVTSTAGFCTDTSRFDVTVNASPRAGFTVNNGTQCQPGNSFIFTNNTTVDAGTLGFLWDLGDGTTATSTDVTHTYVQPGTYRVKMRVGETTGGCADSTEMTVTVNPVAAGDFIVSPVCTNLRVPIINRTRDVAGTVNNYLWDFGNGITSSNKIPVYSYTTPGTYTITLTVNTTQCPLTVSTVSRTVVIDAPAPGSEFIGLQYLLLVPRYAAGTEYRQQRLVVAGHPSQ
ncbi:MAG: PKD domain-containing protein [Chitinophagaceae bacterium]|nr:PKD domain-containing protein [Chitinophagaceae bacterium]